ncbi:hypothetical protein COB52_03130 [Candidatus Kaiserbacteria bacterium]|nr:MAG: hypothetical protein COB52_03130 [Candidatus Kaiserbacteria bacterium]
MIKKFFITIAAVFSLPLLAHAASHTTYVSLVDLGGRFAGASGDLGQYFNNLFDLALLIGSILAVLLIATAGLQYMTTDAVSGTTAAKDRIRQAVMGILMLLAIWIFFNEVNPNILKLDFSLEPATTYIKEATAKGTPVVPAGGIVYAGDTKTKVLRCDLPGRPTCAEVVGSCSRNGATKNISFVDANTVACSKIVSREEYEKEVDDINVRNAVLEDPTISGTVVYYDMDKIKDSNWEVKSNEDLTLMREEQNNIRASWKKSCEVTDTGESTGSTFRPVEGLGGSVGWICSS